MNKQVVKFSLILALFTGCSHGEDNKLTELSYLKISEPPKMITMEIKNYCPTNSRRNSLFFMVNESMKIEKNELRNDWDRDGLSNFLDNNAKFNIDFRTADTNNDGYGDMVIYTTGVEAEKQEQMAVCFDKTVDTDLDGLNDCEERLISTRADQWDTDGDLLSDRLEVRFGMNPSDPNDVYQDADNDGVDNFNEVLKNTNILDTETEQTLMYALQYKREEFGPCSDITISNIPIVPVSNGNALHLYVIEQVVPGNGNPSYFEQKEFIDVIQRSVENGAILKREYRELLQAGK